MLTNKQLDELTTRLLKKIAPKLGIELEEEELPIVTTIKDKNDLTHDLSKLVNTQCLIDTGESTFMAVQDFHDIDADPYWMSWDGGKYTPEELAEYINLMLMGGNGIEITVHKLHS